MRNAHASRVHRRVIVCQVSRTRPVAREATANANGTVKPTKPEVQKRRVEGDERVVLQQHVRDRARPTGWFP